MACNPLQPNTKAQAQYSQTNEDDTSSNDCRALGTACLSAVPARVILTNIGESSKGYDVQ